MIWIVPENKYVALRLGSNPGNNLQLEQIFCISRKSNSGFAVCEYSTTTPRMFDILCDSLLTVNQNLQKIPVGKKTWETIKSCSSKKNRHYARQSQLGFSYSICADVKLYRTYARKPFLVFDFDPKSSEFTFLLTSFLTRLFAFWKIRLNIILEI